MFRKTVKLVLVVVSGLSAGPALSLISNSTSGIARADDGCQKYAYYEVQYAGPTTAICIGAGTGCKICIQDS
jgi:hypothetical protein